MTKTVNPEPVEVNAVEDSNGSTVLTSAANSETPDFSDLSIHFFVGYDDQNRLAVRLHHRVYWLSPVADSDRWRVVPHPGVGLAGQVDGEMPLDVALRSAKQKLLEWAYQDIKSEIEEEEDERGLTPLVTLAASSTEFAKAVKGANAYTLELALRWTQISGQVRGVKGRIQKLYKRLRELNPSEDTGGLFPNPYAAEPYIITDDWESQRNLYRPGRLRECTVVSDTASLSLDVRALGQDNICSVDRFSARVTLPDEWEFIKALESRYWSAYEALTEKLRSLNFFDVQLAITPTAEITNPIAPYAIEVSEPDELRDLNTTSSGWGRCYWQTPQLKCYHVSRHTPKKVRFDGAVYGELEQEIGNQTKYLACPDLDTWETTQVLWEGLIACQERLEQYYRALPRYGDTAEHPELRLPAPAASDRVLSEKDSVVIRNGGPWHGRTGVVQEVYGRSHPRYRVFVNQDSPCLVLSTNHVERIVPEDERLNELGFLVKTQLDFESWDQIPDSGRFILRHCRSGQTAPDLFLVAFKFRRGTDNHPSLVIFRIWGYLGGDGHHMSTAHVNADGPLSLWDLAESIVALRMGQSSKDCAGEIIMNGDVLAIDSGAKTTYAKVTAMSYQSKSGDSPGVRLEGDNFQEGLSRKEVAQSRRITTQIGKYCPPCPPAAPVSDPEDGEHLDDTTLALRIGDSLRLTSLSQIESEVHVDAPQTVGDCLEVGATYRIEGIFARHVFISHPAGLPCPFYRNRRGFWLKASCFDLEQNLVLYAARPRSLQGRLTAIAPRGFLDRAKEVGTHHGLDADQGLTEIAAVVETLGETWLPVKLEENGSDDWRVTAYPLRPELQTVLPGLEGTYSGRLVRYADANYVLGCEVVFTTRSHYFKRFRQK